MSVVTIYALTDPDSGEVRYVGRTSNNPWKRYSEHLMGVGNGTKPWIRALQPLRKVPSLKVLEEGISAEVAGTRERYWIDYYRAQGAPLLNYLHKPKPPSPNHQPSVIPGASGSLQALFQSHGISTYRELHQRIGGSRQHAWNLWYGYTGVGKGTARRLQETLGVPYDELMRILPIPRTKRIRKRPPEGS